MLKNYQGKIQTDGYGVCEHFEKNEDITLFSPIKIGIYNLLDPCPKKNL